MARKRLIARAAAGGSRWSAMTSALLAGVALWLCLGSGSALAVSSEHYFESDASQLCADSGSGAPGTEVRQESCAEYSNHSGSYQEYWAPADLAGGEHLEAYHEYNGQAMCLTIRNGALEVGTPLVMEPCGGALALGQRFAAASAVPGGGTLLKAYAESGRKVDNLSFSDYCVASHGGVGTALVIERCNNRLATQSWLGLTDEGSPGLPGPGDPTA